MRPILFEKGTESFTTNGLGVLRDCISCVVTEEINGVFEAEFEYPISGIHYSDITDGSIIRVVLPSWQTYDRTAEFIVYGKTAKIDGVVKFHARHISYMLNTIVVSPFTATSLSDAVSKLKNQSLNNNPFTFSVIGLQTSKNVEVNIPASARSILFNTLLEEYGGELSLYGYRIQIVEHLGHDNGVRIKYGKNMTDVQQTVDSERLFNSVVPYWNGGDGAIVVYGGLVTATGQTAAGAAALDLSQEYDTAPSVATLEARALSYLDSATPWIPDTNIKVSYVELSKTKEYGEVAPFEEIFLGDTVTVEYLALGVSTKARIIKTTYDVLAERYTEIEIGNPQPTLVNTIINTASRKIADEYVSKSGDTMTGNLAIQNASPRTVYYSTALDSTVGQTIPSSDSVVGGTQIQDKNGYNNGWFRIYKNTNDSMSCHLCVRRSISGTAISNALSMGIRADGTRSVSVSESAPWRSAIGAVYTGGDTMTGSLGIKGTDTAGTTPSSNYYSPGFNVCDKNGFAMGYYNHFYYTNGTYGIQLGAQRSVSGTMKYNTLILGLDTSGNPTVGLGGTNSAAAWRSAIGAAPASSSSIRYKHDIKDMSAEHLDAHRLYKLKAQQFVFNDNHDLQYEDMRGQILPGFIAEEVAEIYPAAVIHDADGNIENWDERRIIPGMLKLIQEQRKQIDDLTDRLARLEALMGV